MAISVPLPRPIILLDPCWVQISTLLPLFIAQPAWYIPIPISFNNQFAPKCVVNISHEMLWYHKNKPVGFKPLRYVEFYQVFQGYFLDLIWCSLYGCFRT